MELYIQAAAMVLVVVILGLMLNVQHKGMANLASLAACCMLCVAVVRYLQPVVELLGKIRSLAGISDQMLSILLKSTGVGLVSELACLICADAGNASMGKAVQILSNAVILWISLPLFDQLLELLQEVLGSA